MPRVQSPLHHPSCRLSSGSTNSVGMCVEFPPYLDLVFVFVFVFRHVEIGIKEHAPPHQPLSMSGQGVGKFEQSFLSGHHGAPACLHTWGTTITQSYECILLRGTFFVFVFFLVQTSPGGPFCPQQPPTKAIPMLSVWILGTGLRAHVEPFEERGKGRFHENIARIANAVQVTFYPHFLEWCV